MVYVKGIIYNSGLIINKWAQAIPISLRGSARRFYFPNKKIEYSLLLSIVSYVNGELALWCSTYCISTFRKAEVTQLLPDTHFGSSLFHISDIHVPSDTRHMPVLYSSIQCQIPVKYPSNSFFFVL